MASINQTSRTQQTIPNQGASSTEDAQKTETGGGVSGTGKDVPLPGTTGGNDANTVRNQRMALQGNGPGNNSAAEGRLQSALEKLNDPNASVADKLEALLGAIRDPDILAKLMIEFAAMGRQNALDTRLATREQARADLMGQAQETREAALKQLISAVVTLVVAVASAALTISMAGSSLKESKASFSNAKDGAQATKMGTTIGEKTQKGAALMKQGADASSEAAFHANKAQIITTKMQAFNQVMTAAGTVGSTLTEYSGKMDEAEGQELAANAQIAQSDSDMAKKFMDDLEEMIKTALNFVREMQNAEVELMKNMTF